jgi:TetR/AcrR family acrAB operon transcriptional repressor
MRRTKKEAAATREAVLDAALAIFGRMGYAAATLGDVAQAALVTRGAVYWHFGSKADLYSALVTERFGRASAAILAAADGVATPVGKLRAILVAALTRLETDPDYRAIVELTLFKTEGLPEIATSLDAKKAALRSQRELAASFIADAKARGEVDPDVDPGVVAITLLGLVNGVAVLWLLDPGAFSLATQAERSVDLALSAITRSAGSDRGPQVNHSPLLPEAGS